MAAKINLRGRAKAYLDGLTWPRILKIAFVMAVLSGIHTFAMVPRTYDATTSVLLNNGPDLMGSLGVLSSSGQGAGASLAASLGGISAPQDNMKNILQSYTVRAKVIKDVAIKDGKVVNKLDLASRLGVSESMACEMLAGMTSIQKMSTVGLSLSVSCAGPSRLDALRGSPSAFTTEEAKEFAAAIANAYMAAANEYMTGTSNNIARSTVKFITQRLKEAESDLRPIESALQDLQTKYALTDPQAMAQNLITQTGDITKTYATAIADASAARHSLETAHRQISEEDRLVVSQEMRMRNPVIDKLELDRADAQVKYDLGLATGKAASHSEMRTLKAQIDAIDKRLADVQQQVLAQVSNASNPAYVASLTNVVNLEGQLAGAEAQKAHWANVLAMANRETASLPPVMRKYVGLRRQQELQTKIVATLTERLKMAEIEANIQNADRFTVLDKAFPPEKKSGPSSARSAALVFMMTCLLFGVYWARQNGVLKLD